MRVFVIFELFIVLVLCWLIANIIRYSFFKGSTGGGFFSLSDSWLKKEGER